MADYVTLLGADDVARAGHQMQHAADQMQRAAGNFEFALQQHQQFLTAWLQDLQAVLEKGKQP